MKKRSLIASIAMLLVSAIAMTSSTYAWFATGTTAKVSNVEASIVNNDGSIALAVSQDGPYKTTLNKSDFAGNDGDWVLDNFFTNNLYPVSFDLGGMYTGSIVQDTTSGSPTYGEMIFNHTYEESVFFNAYTRYSVYIKATKDCTVEVTPTFETTNVSYIYALLSTRDTYGVFSTTNGRSYYPLVDDVDGIDVNNNGIMDFEDKAMNGVDPYSGIDPDYKIEATNKPLQYELKAEIPVRLSVIIWAEGQDPACVGPVSDGFIQFGIDFRVV